MRFGGLVAVNDLSFTVGRGDITALIGPNGAGKTTVFNCITGFYKPTEGRIALAHGDAAMWDELDALTCRGARSLSRSDGALFLLERMPDYLDRPPRPGRPHVPEHPPVRRHDGAGKPAGRAAQPADARLGLHRRSACSGSPAIGRAERAAIEKARHWLALIGLIERADDPAGALPYGAQRRLEIARAMCTDPVLLCLDEPAAGLNPRESAELNALILTIRDEHRRLGAADRARHERGDGASPTTSSCSTTASRSPTARRPRSAPTPRSSPPISASRTRRSRRSEAEVGL